MRVKLFLFAGIAFALVGRLAAGTLVLAPKETAPPSITKIEPWQFNLATPGWLASISGEVGLGGVNTDVDVGFDKLIRHAKGLASFSADARYDRFGVYGDVLYMGLSEAV